MRVSLLTEEEIMARRQPRGGAMGEQSTTIIPFPHPHRGDPNSRRTALASIGFRWTGSAWRRGRVVLIDFEIDAMAEPTWAPCL
jgi:hypothetical protein